MKKTRPDTGLGGGKLIKQQDFSHLLETTLAWPLIASKPEHSPYYM